MRGARSILVVVFRQRCTEEWDTLLRAHGVPEGPVNDVPSAFADPQTQDESRRVSGPAQRRP
jgi:crotonobetainyl-CoA:carnitine CoA-transferase CaiB-like acyl-CoA transferase